MEGYFHYNTEYRILICLPCGAGIKPLHLKAHLKGLHSDYPEVQSSIRLRSLLAQLEQHDLVTPTS